MPVSLQVIEYSSINPGTNIFVNSLILNVYFPIINIEEDMSVWIEVLANPSRRYTCRLSKVYEDISLRLKTRKSDKILFEKKKDS